MVYALKWRGFTITYYHSLLEHYGESCRVDFPPPVSTRAALVYTALHYSPEGVRMTIDLTDKVALVTGAGAGIGREIALTMGREGATIVALDMDAERLTELGRSFSDEGISGMQVQCNVTEESQIAGAVRAALDAYSRIDILVNNAGIAGGAPVESLPVEKWDANFNVNTRGTFLMSQAVIPAMKAQRWGRILNAASFAAIVPSVGGAAYAASKSAIIGFTRVLAGELGPWNVTVNCYAPGMIPTGMNNFAGLPDEKKETLLNLLTIRRWGEPRDVANLICFLASDLADYITGTLIDVSGGKLATQRPYAAYDMV